MFRRVPILLGLGIGCAVAGFAADAPDRNSSRLPISTDAGDRVLEFDFPGLRIGIAEYADGPTGTTVFRFATPASVAMDVRGGSPGVVGDYGIADAIVLAGGSLFGLEAVSGVASRLLAERGNRARWDLIPVISGGVIYDFDGRDNSIYPDKRLGRAAAVHAVAGRFPLGARGAGIAATVGKGADYSRGEPAGQGAAFRETGGVKILACTVLNAVGAVYGRQGELVRGHPFAAAGGPTAFTEGIAKNTRGPTSASAPAGDIRAGAGRNTTLTVVVTDLVLARHDLVQVGRQLHTSMAQAIRPFHTRNDGDTLWMVSTNETNLPRFSATAFGVVATEVLWDAVLAAHP